MLVVIIPGIAYSAIQPYTKWQKHIVHKIDKNGPQSLNFFEKASIYSFACVMILGGLVHGYPEVAKEQSHMMWEGDDERSFHSNFAMQAPEIRRAAVKFAKKIQNKKNRKFIYKFYLYLYV